ncbi:MAG TPA: nucleotide sugar dehydrogenase [Steroidobacteraceae bacterium]|nr:nucleotide sugar dehydrogenase [Steroidobacteraceae bacterium]
MNVAVVGLGKIGLPLAVQCAAKGATVAGYDVDAARVAQINDRRNPLPSEPGLDERLPGAVAAGRLRATTDPGDAGAAADVVILSVPVDIDGAHAPDFALLDAAVDAVAPHLQRSALVIVETTVPVGTTRRRVGGRIAAATGMEAGTRFALAFSPERVSSGTVLRDLARYPKIVGGIDAHSTARAADFYRGVLDADVMTVRDAETAEFSKLAETTYRDVNIALANEFAVLADRHGVDVLQAIGAANSQPYSHIHSPGAGVGGHCIPVYPYFLAADNTELIAAARRRNDGMAAYAVQKLEAALGPLQGATVVVLGLAYRAGVKESRHSSAFGLAAALAASGATAYVHDPLYTAEEIRAHGLEPPPAFPLPCDALVVQAWHAGYAELDLGAFTGLRAVLDGRGALEPGTIEAMGVAYVGIGR